MANKPLLDVQVKVEQLNLLINATKAQVLKDENEITRRATFKTRKQAQALVLKRFEARKSWSQKSVYAKIYDKYPHKPVVGRVAMSLRKWGVLKWPIDGGIRTPDSIEDAGDWVLVRIDGKRGRSGSTKLFDFAARAPSDAPVFRGRFGKRSGLLAVPMKNNPEHRLVLRTQGRVVGRGSRRRVVQKGRPVAILVPRTQYQKRTSFDHSVRKLAVRNLHLATRQVFGRTRAKLPR